jgi:hypothetical protein
MTLVGFTALSVDTITNSATPWRSVVLDGLPRVPLHHGDVLVGCCMKYDLRSVFEKQLLHAFLVSDVGDAGRQGDVGHRPGQLGVDLK